jgi:hypothetical protein
MDRNALDISGSHVWMRDTFRISLRLLGARGASDSQHRRGLHCLPGFVAQCRRKTGRTAIFA